MINHKTLDGPTVSGQFGWERIGTEGLAIPVILRNNGIRYSPVRIVEQEIIKKFDKLPQQVFQCITLKSFYLSPNEAKLLNLINFNHCNNYYGEILFNSKDRIVAASDVKDLLRFLHISQKIFHNEGADLVGKFGIVKFPTNPQKPEHKLPVPYLGKSYNQSNQPGRFVPLRLVENFVWDQSIQVQGQPTDWDVMYLQMLSIYSENNAAHLINRDCSIVLLENLMYPSTRSRIVYEDCFTKGDCR